MTTVRRSLDSRGDGHILDITSSVAEAVHASELSQGVATVFVTGSTAGLTTIEYEPGLVHDLSAAFDMLSARGVSFEAEPRLIAKLPDHELWMAFFRDPDAFWVGQSMFAKEMIFPKGRNPEEVLATGTDRLGPRPNGMMQNVQR